MANILLWFITLLIPFTYCTTITLPITLFFPTLSPPSSSSQLHILNSLVSTSLARSKVLKSTHQPSSTTASAPLYTHSYGAYSTSLSFGTPPQTIPFILQTSTDITWLPCTHKYICKNCTSPSPAFIPKASSSSRFLPCINPKCAWFHNTDTSSRCQDCETPFSNCSQVCPPYIVSSGPGYTGGVLLIETLDLAPQKQVPEFIVGCSLFSSNQPAGVIGLGRGLASLPSQLQLNKFSFCFLSHKFDDTNKTSNLLLDLGPTMSPQKTANLSYVRFSRNPSFPNYYYLPLRKITVGSRPVKIPYKYLSPQTDGSGGTIIDSSIAFSTMTSGVFEAVSSAFVTHAAAYSRDTQLETASGLTPCFNVSGYGTILLPEMSFYFKGGAKMSLPLANYYSFMGESNDDGVCLTLLKDDSGDTGGPAVILGNYQMQNIYAEFDLRNDRFGFMPEKCY